MQLHHSKMFQMAKVNNQQSKKVIDIKKIS